MSQIVHTETTDNDYMLNIVFDSGTESPLDYSIEDGSIKFIVFDNHYNNSSKEIDSVEALEEFIAANTMTNEWAIYPLSIQEHGTMLYEARTWANIPPADWDGAIALKCSEWGSGGTIESANAICKEYTSWCNGEVYGYRILGPLDPNEESGLDGDREELDSCWGFIGDPSGYVLEDARRLLEYHSDEFKQAIRRAVADRRAK